MSRNLSDGISTLLGRLVVAAAFGAVGYFLFTVASTIAAL